MRLYRNGHGRSDMVTASEIAALVYCNEQWRLEHGLGLEPANRQALDAGTRHHAGRVVAEQIAGCSIMLGRSLAVVAIVVLLLLLWLGGDESCMVDRPTGCQRT
jgi:hypothetical protein